MALPDKYTRSDDLITWLATFYDAVSLIQSTANAANADKFLWPKLTQGASDPSHDITLTAGSISDSTGAAKLTITAMTKQIDAAWGAGDNAGGLFSGTVAADTTYHKFIIKNVTTGAVDAGWDTSLTAANKPSGYTLYRRIWSFKTDGAAILRPMIFWGDYGYFKTPILDIDTAQNATVATRTFASLPTGIRLLALTNGYINDAAALAAVYMKPTDAVDLAPSNNAAPLSTLRANITGATAVQLGTPVEVLTDTSAQVTTRANASITAERFALTGYVDQRID